jgi:hypothetical protein
VGDGEIEMIQRDVGRSRVAIDKLMNLDGYGVHDGEDSIIPERLMERQVQR